MPFEAQVNVAVALFSAVLGVLVLIRDRRPAVNRTLALGLLLLAGQELCKAGINLATTPELARTWQLIRSGILAFNPGAWLYFALTYARWQPRHFVRRWRWVLAVTAVLPPALVAFAPRSLVASVSSAGTGWLLHLGWSGYALHLACLVGAVLVLMNLEWTLHQAAGGMRWRIKHVFLGLGFLFAVEIYCDSQALLVSSLAGSILQVHTGALLVADLFFLASLLWTRPLDAEIHVAGTPLHPSLTLIGTSVYLLAAGLLPLMASRLGRTYADSLTAFSLFLVVLAVTTLLLSDRLRRKFRRAVDQALVRPRFDYRRVWLAYTQRTRAVVDAPNLCRVTASMVSETFHSPSVTLWLAEEEGPGVTMGGSTVFSEAQAEALLADTPPAFAELSRVARERTEPIDLFDHPACASLERAFLEKARAHYAAPLFADGEYLGFLTLGERFPNPRFSIEELDLVETIAHHVAARLLQLRLSAQLLRAKEMEAFQSLSAFFIHDLKNLASTLSMTMQNLPQHGQDPAFREDMLRVMSRSVSRIDDMCRRLSPLSTRLELQRAPVDLNQVVRAALAGLDSGLRSAVATDLRPLPSLSVDPDQIQKVLVNLLLNADEATSKGGEIRVSTAAADGWAVLSVSDTGCGMTREFIHRSLFQPFRTTKKRGLGIGLYHARTIIEAHSGRIEVESEPGKGSTFRVRLPLAPSNDPGSER